MAKRDHNLLHISRNWVDELRHRAASQGSGVSLWSTLVKEEYIKSTMRHTPQFKIVSEARKKVSTTGFFTMSFLNLK